jgi:hypothetical protein
MCSSHSIAISNWRKQHVYSKNYVWLYNAGHLSYLKIFTSCVYRNNHTSVLHVYFSVISISWLLKPAFLEELIINQSIVSSSTEFGKYEIGNKLYRWYCLLTTLNHVISCLLQYCIYLVAEIHHGRDSWDNTVNMLRTALIGYDTNKVTDEYNINVNISTNAEWYFDVVLIWSILQYVSGHLHGVINKNTITNTEVSEQLRHYK